MTFEFLTKAERTIEVSLPIAQALVEDYETCTPALSTALPTARWVVEQLLEARDLTVTMRGLDPSSVVFSKASADLAAKLYRAGATWQRLLNGPGEGMVH